MRKSKKNKIIYSLLLVVVVFLFWAIEHFLLPSLSKTGNEARANLPAWVLPNADASAVVTHNYYTLEYSEIHEQARWVAYPLTRSHLTSDDRRRPYFEEDPGVKTFSADWRNYRKSGYDRGHLCPAGDRRFSEAAYNETFYTSNISPMKSDFNAGVWNRLEIQVRNWARKYDSLYVITGGVLRQGLPTIGYEGVTVPPMFYKIVVRQKGEDLEAIAFLIPHGETSQPLETFRVSIDHLEEETGIDFFESLPDSLESRLEEGVKDTYWPF